MVKDKRESDVMVESLSLLQFNSREMTTISAFSGFSASTQGMTANSKRSLHTVDK